MTIAYEITNCAGAFGPYDILAALGAYLGEGGPCTGIVTMDDLPLAWVVRLSGKPSNPAAGFPEHKDGANAGLFEERWFYVQWYNKNSLAVKTRHPDEYTLAVMRGWAEFAARYWQGELSTP